eukprot:Hpha_TRINITY_DN15392_c3_g13::TRINITY_DN15392_c3_g13_i1::g.90640::m.90640
MGDRRDYDRDRDYRDRGRDRDDRGYSGKGDKGGKDGKGKGKDGKDRGPPPTRAWATRKLEVQTLSHFMCFKCGETKDRTNFSNSQLLTGRQQCTQCSTLKVAQNLADQMAFSAAARQSRIDQNDPTKPSKSPIDAAREELDKNGKTGLLCECGALVNSRQQLIQHQRGQKCLRPRPEGEILRLTTPSATRKLLAIGDAAAGGTGGAPVVPARPKKPDQPAHPKSIIAKRLMRDGAKLWEWNKMIMVEPAATQIAGAGTLKPVFSFKARLTAHENSWVQGDFETTKKAAERSALDKLALWIQEQPESLSTTGRQSLANWMAPRSVKVVIIPAYRKGGGNPWTCGNCQHHNRGIDIACTSCGEPRTAQAGAAPVDATQDSNFAKICAVLGGSADWAYPGSEAEADWEGSWMPVKIHIDQAEAVDGTVRIQWEDQSLSDMPPNLIRPKQTPAAA